MRNEVSFEKKYRYLLYRVQHALLDVFMIRIDVASRSAGLKKVVHTLIISQKKVLSKT
jgi:hypothetical protein